MRIVTIAATLALAAPVLLSAQKPSSSRVYTSSNGSVAQPETVYVKGNVYGIVPSGSNYVITGSKTSFKVDTIYTGTTSTTTRMEMNTEPKSDLEKTTDKAGLNVSAATKKAGKDI